MGNPKNKPKPKTETKEADKTDKTVKDASKAKPKEEAPKKAK